MKVLVTGGAGFIGSHLVDKLLEDNNEVIIIDNFSNGKKENLDHHKENKNLKVFNKDICDENIEELFEGVKIVYHLAALSRVQYSIDNPKKTTKTNIGGILNLLEICRKKRIKRFVYSSSSSIYGDQNKLPLKEEMVPNPMSPYALQKLTGEHYCKVYHLVHGIETISLRYFNVFGPRQDPEGGYACLIPKSIKLTLENKKPTINGDGEQTRDFSFVNDIVNANILAGETTNKEAFGKAFNIGNSNNISINEVVKTIIGDKNIKPTHLPPVIEPKDTLADASFAKKILGWQPNNKFTDSIKKTMEWFKENKKWK